MLQPDQLATLAMPDLFADLTRPLRAHLVGIAGAGMRALAEVLCAWGWPLSGSDLAIGSASRLAAAGVRLYEGHAAGQVPADVDLVIYSDAIPPENPELRRAAELGLPACSYFQMAGRLMSSRRGLAVAGTHGKSTTTAMAAQILNDAGCDSTVLCGATPLGRTSGGRAGGGNLMLVEACEYRANFLHLAPTQAIILGIEPDHFDCYDSPADLQQAFARFAALLPDGGLLLAHRDCPVTRRVVEGLPCRVETFAIDGQANPSRRQADWEARTLSCRRGRYGFEIRRHGRHFADVCLRVLGRHNVLNALAAAALAWENGVPADRIGRSLGRFAGLHRRCQVRGTFAGVTCVDDYAHHPTEVAATLRAAREGFPGRRLWCVFQPHQSSRTARLLDELAESLQNADGVLVAEIFRAREGPPRAGEVTAADLAERIRAGPARPGPSALCRPPQVPPLHAIAEIQHWLKKNLRPADVLVTMGAGDIGKVVDGLLDRI